MGQAQEERSVWYFSQAQGWIHEQEPADAKYRLTAIARAQHYVQIENKLEETFDRGGWTEVTPDVERMLPAITRGLVFQVKPVQTEKGSFVEIHSKRYLDKEMLNSLYEGFQLFDKHGDVLADPELAFDIVLIQAAAADTFYARVRTVGGKIVEAQADLQSMYVALQKLEVIYSELSNLCQQSRSVVDRVADGIRSDAPSISERSKIAHHRRDQAAELVDFIRSEKMTLDKQPGEIEQKSYGEAYLGNAEQWLGWIEKAHREHKSYEVQAVSRIQEAIAQSLPSAADAPASTRRYLFIAVVEYYTERNYDCRLTPDGMIIRLDDVTIELGESIKVLSNGAVQEAAPVQQRLVDRSERQI